MFQILAIKFKYSKNLKSDFDAVKRKVGLMNDYIDTVVQLGPKLNNKFVLNHHHPPPPPATRNFSKASRHIRRLRFVM